MPTIKDEVFAEVALRDGKISAEKVSLAFESQAEMGRFGIGKFLGAILVERNLLSKETVSAVLESLARVGVRCPGCQAVCSIEECDRHGDLKCRACGRPVVFPDGKVPSSEIVEVSGGSAHREARRPAGKPAPPPRPESEDPAEVERGASPPHRQRRGARSLAPEEKVFRSGYDLEPFARPTISRLRVKELLGVSSNGRLYRIQDTGSFGALKLLDPRLCADKKVFRKWVDCMQRVQDVPRTATLRPTQLCREETVDYVTRPFVDEDGATLRARLASGVAMAASDIAAQMTAILGSVAAFHSLRMAHGNLKPENVLFSSGSVLLTDPGMLLLLDGLEPDSRLLRLADVARYVAPEVLQGNEPTPAADVFAVGRFLEDLLGLPSGDAGRTTAETSLRLGLRSVALQMTRPDPGERPPSAKEALRDLQKASAPGPRPTRVDAPAGPTRRAGPRSPWRACRSPRVVGAVILAAIALGLALRGVAWTRACSALRSPDRPGRVSWIEIRKELDAAAAWTRESGSEPQAVRERWEEIEDLFRGTSAEEEVGRMASAARASIEKGCDPKAEAAMDKASDLARQSRWVEAIQEVIAWEAEMQDTPRWREFRSTIADGAYRELGMVWVPAGDVPVGCSSDGRRSRVASFLIDAGPVRADAAAAQEGPAGAEAEPGPVRALNLREAARLARKLGKRLPTVAEWRRMYAYASSSEPGAAEASRRLVGLDGPFLEWAEGVETDNLSQAGYGFCVGGTRGGVSPAQPVRRWAAYGFPDVGVRFARTLERPRE